MNKNWFMASDWIGDNVNEESLNTFKIFLTDVAIPRVNGAEKIGLCDVH